MTPIRKAMLEVMKTAVLENQAAGKGADLQASITTAFTSGLRFMADQFEAMEKRVAELEKLPFKFMGPFTEGMDYSKGMFCSFQGGMWHANCETRERPGTGYDWTLCVKRGADGKGTR